MTLIERCRSCGDYEFCLHAYGRYFKYRAMGWREEWSTDEQHKPAGCRHWIPPQKSAKKEPPTQTT